MSWITCKGLGDQLLIKHQHILYRFSIWKAKCYWHSVSSAILQNNTFILSVPVVKISRLWVSFMGESCVPDIQPMRDKYFLTARQIETSINRLSAAATYLLIRHIITSWSSRATEMQRWILCRKVVGRMKFLYREISNRYHKCETTN